VWAPSPLHARCPRHFADLILPNSAELFLRHIAGLNNLLSLLIRIAANGNVTRFVAAGERFICGMHMKFGEFGIAVGIG
jgi:hypothetical protein